MVRPHTQSLITRKRRFLKSSIRTRPDTQPQAATITDYVNEEEKLLLDYSANNTSALKAQHNAKIDDSKKQIDRLFSKLRHEFSLTTGKVDFNALEKYLALSQQAKFQSDF